MAGSDRLGGGSARRRRRRGKGGSCSRKTAPRQRASAIPDGCPGHRWRRWALARLHNKIIRCDSGEPCQRDPGTPYQALKISGRKELNMAFLWDLLSKKHQVATAAEALPGRPDPLPTATTHFVFQRPLFGPVPDGHEVAIFGMGCFWGAERKFWQLGEGIWSTSVGYAGGHTPNPTYQETCSGLTGHTEVVRVVFDPAKVSYARLLKTFWENHDPTQGMRQGNDVGTQYRSALYTTTPAQADEADASRRAYQAALTAKGLGAITTEQRAAPAFYAAEEYHQQYLAKNPGGYCGLGGTGVSCPIGVAAVAT
jgi:peptide-methionine (S)-S-oxide reductase